MMRFPDNFESQFEVINEEESVWIKKKMSVPFSNMYLENAMKYIIYPGNNSKLLREVMKWRSWWVEMPPMPCIANFKWAPVSNGIKFG